MLNDILGDLTLASFLKNLLWTGIFAGLGRMVMFALKIPVQKEVAYWISLPLLIFAVIVFVGRPATGPNLKIDFTGTAGNITPPNDGPHAYVSLIARVTNVGEPTSAWGYILKMTLSNGTVVVGERKLIPREGFVLGAATSKTAELMCGADALENKTLAPIARGGQQIGRLFYEFPTLTEQVFMSGVKLELVVADAWGREWSGTSSGTATRNTGTMNFPGIAPQPPTLPTVPSVPANQSATQTVTASLCP